MDASGSGIGQPVRRKEDLRLLTGKGRYTDDINLPNQARAVLVRSPHAHAHIVKIDIDAAHAMPGVLMILTGADVIAQSFQSVGNDNDGFGPREAQMKMPDVVLWNRDGSDMYPTPLLPLATDRVRFVGHAVAFVVAETTEQAKDAADHVVVEYETLPSASHVADAIKPDATLLWNQKTNIPLDAEIGDAAATDAAFAAAAHTVRLKTWIQRVTGVPMEPRAAIAGFDAASNRVTVYAAIGAGAARLKAGLVRILRWSPEQLRVVTYDVGGSFGTRNSMYTEFALVAWASRQLNRSIKWVSDRQEAFVSDYHGRDIAADAELALDADGKFLAMRASYLSNLGAHGLAIVPLRKCVGIISGVYDVATAHVEARGVITNTQSTVPYRSAGRPEAMFILERLIDLAAREHGFDRVELRRRNLIGVDSFPYRNPVGVTYDNGEYERVMDRVLELGDWNGFANRRQEAKTRGKRRGISLANYIECTTGIPRERAELVVRTDGHIEIRIGTMSSGQGHETSFAQCVSQWLGVPFAKIILVTNDTDIVPIGGGSNSGRSMRYAGVLMGDCSDQIIAKGKRITGHIMEAAPDDIAFADGRFTVTGTDRSLGLFEVAAAAQQRNDLPDDLHGPLRAERDEVFKVAGFPFGAHVCEVEVDIETGYVDLVRYTAVDDVGTAVNPLILHGQTHGAVAQGVGQALWEDCHYDRKSGQLLSGSLMDYAMPRADVMPSIDSELSELPSPTNKLGVRAGGEGGTTPALAVVINAIVDALAEYGVRHIEMPATPERVWRAIHATKS